FFTCGFHVAFITTHLPPYLVDKGLEAKWGGWVIALIGLFNIIGSIAAGVLGGKLPKRYLLSTIYFLRALAIAGFMLVPLSPASGLWRGSLPRPPEDALKKWEPVFGQRSCSKRTGASVLQSDENAIYLAPTEYVDSDHPAIEAFVARAVTPGMPAAEKVRRFYL